MTEITASATSDPNPVDRKAMSVPALTTHMVAILRMVIGVSPRFAGEGCTRIVSELLRLQTERLRSRGE